MPTQVDHLTNKVFHPLIPHNKLLDMVDLQVDPQEVPQEDPQEDPLGILAKVEVAFMVDLPNLQGDTDHPILDMVGILEDINNHPMEIIRLLGLIKDHHLHRKVVQTTPLVVLFHLVLCLVCISD